MVPRPVGMVVMLAACLAAGQRARAQDDDARARAQAIYQRGLRHYNLAEYDDAIAAFKEAYAIVPAPGFLYNIAQAYRLQGDCASSARFYRTYLREAPDADNRPRVERFIEEMDACERERAAAPDAGPPEAVPPVPAIDAAPPEPKPVFVPIAVPDPAARGRGLRVGGMSTAGAGLALIGTGAYFGLRARDAAGDVDALYAAGGVWDHDYIELEQRGQRDGRIAVVLYATGGAALATGAVLYYLGWRRGRAPVVTPAFGGAAVSWTW